MSALQIFILALIQGITEFLPISSSGHLILLPTLTSWPDQGYFIDVAVHVGTLLAVILYFWRDMKGVTLGAFASFGVKPAQRAVDGTHYRKLFWAMVIGTIPMVIFGGFLVMTGLNDALRSATVIAITSIVFGVLLYLADMRGGQEKTIERMAVKPALLIGLAQIFALIPGTSRSGVTMTAARALGFTRTDAARFSMLLSIPAIIASGAATLLDALDGTAPLPWQDALITGALSLVFALIAIKALMAWLARASMTIFVVYRVGLGIGLLIMINSGML